MEIQELEELEEMLEMTQNEDEQNDGTRKLSDVQMRRQARVDWKPEAVLQQISALFRSWTLIGTYKSMKRVQLSVSIWPRNELHLMPSQCVIDSGTSKEDQGAEELSKAKKLSRAAMPLDQIRLSTSFCKNLSGSVRFCQLLVFACCLDVVLGTDAEVYASHHGTLEAEVHPRGCEACWSVWDLRLRKAWTNSCRGAPWFGLEICESTASCRAGHHSRAAMLDLRPLEPLGSRLG